jgi:UrcA family protein
MKPYARLRRIIMLFTQGIGMVRHLPTHDKDKAMRPKHFASVSLVSALSVCAVAQSTEYATVVAKADFPAKTVSYGDLNLQRHEGIATLYRRIQTAANLVCSQVNERPPQVALRIRDCASSATTRAVSEVGMPALTTLHAQQTGNAPTTRVAARE